MKIICSTRIWEKDTLFLVAGSKTNPKVEEKDLSECLLEKRLCVRRQNMETESFVGSARNLYEVLRLNMKNVRGKGLEEQNEIITKAFIRQFRRWYPDRNQEPVDDHICEDPEKHATYNNEVEYNNGWLSVSRGSQ